MQLHHIRSTNARQQEKRRGRGGKRGTFSGKGTKGQRSRAGARIRPAERDIIKKIPKLRGYRFRSIQRKAAVVNLDTIERVFKAGDAITPKSLFAAGLIRRQKGILPRVKILGRGATKKRFTFKDVTFSRSVSARVGDDSPKKTATVST